MTEKQIKIITLQFYFKKSFQDLKTCVRSFLLHITTISFTQTMHMFLSLLVTQLSLIPCTTNTS